jgi:hypothetical protein
MIRRLALEAIELLLSVVLGADDPTCHDYELPLALRLVRRELARERGLYVITERD